MMALANLNSTMRAEGKTGMPCIVVSCECKNRKGCHGGEAANVGLYPRCTQETGLPNKDDMKLKDLCVDSTHCAYDCEVTEVEDVSGQNYAGCMEDPEDHDPELKPCVE